MNTHLRPASAGEYTCAQGLIFIGLAKRVNVQAVGMHRPYGPFNGYLPPPRLASG